MTVPTRLPVRPWATTTNGSRPTETTSQTRQRSARVRDCRGCSLRICCSCSPARPACMGRAPRVSTDGERCVDPFPRVWRAIRSSRKRFHSTGRGQSIHPAGAESQGISMNSAGFSQATCFSTCFRRAAPCPIEFQPRSAFTVGATRGSVPIGRRLEEKTGALPANASHPPSSISGSSSWRTRPQFGLAIE